ncbi:cell division protein FtsQ/DivIB [Lysobacter sp. A3-1-A15]|uniref:cell division protein FtsQ/DivIB n=1 Tax=Novilysobacter viscosus TaxID=3098602 RepID=UPI002EDAD4C7
MSALLRLLGWLLAVALVVAPVVAVVNGWVGSEQWPLQRMRATGTFERVDDARLREALLPYARQGFFAVDLDRAQSAVAALPWVETAKVRKRWPDVLEVTVTEHRPFARWGDDQLLSEHGRLFPVSGIEVPAGLPRLSGPDARVHDVVELYNESRDLIAGAGLQVREVALDARGSWTLELDGGTELVVGRAEAHARIARFVRLVPQLLAQPTQRLARADLRYTNGFALTWAPMPTDGDAPSQQQDQT